MEEVPQQTWDAEDIGTFVGEICRMEGFSFQQLLEMVINEFMLAEFLSQYPQEYKKCNPTEAQLAKVLTYDLPLDQRPRLDGHDGAGEFRTDLAKIYPHPGCPFSLIAGPEGVKQVLLALSPRGKVLLLCTVVHTMAYSGEFEFSNHFFKNVMRPIARMGCFKLSGISGVMLEHHEFIRPVLESIANAFVFSYDEDIPHSLWPHQPKQVPAVVNRGILNTGNSCFLNCALMVLYHCFEFSQAMMAEPFQSQVSNAIVSLFRSLTHPVRWPVTYGANRLQELVSTWFPNYPQGQQNDPHAFINDLLDHLETFWKTQAVECLAAREGVTIAQLNTDPGLVDMVRDWFPTHMFRFGVKTYKECSACGSPCDPSNLHSEEVFRAGLTLPLDLESSEPKTTSQLLDNFFKHKPGICDTCTSEPCEGDGGLRSYLSSCPQYFLLQIDRAVLTDDGVVKATTPVVATTNLSLEPYLPPDSGTPADYVVNSLVIHLGNSAQAGHYICMVYFNVIDRWMVINDNKVEPAIPSEIETFWSNVSLVTYRKKNTDVSIMESAAVAEHWFGLQRGAKKSSRDSLESISVAVAVQSFNLGAAAATPRNATSSRDSLESLVGAFQSLNLGADAATPRTAFSSPKEFASPEEFVSPKKVPEVSTGDSYTTPLIQRTFSEDSEDVTPKDQATLTLKLKKYRTANKQLRTAYKTLQRDNSRLIQTNENQSKSFGDLVSEQVRSNKAAEDERNRLLEASKDEGKRRHLEAKELIKEQQRVNIAAEDERKRREKAAEDEAKRRHDEAQKLIDEQIRVNKAAEADRMAAMIVFQRMVDGKGAQTTPVDTDGGTKEEVSDQKLAVTVYSSIHRFPAEFSTVLEPGSTIDDVKEAVANALQFRVGDQLFVRGKGTKFVRFNEVRSQVLVQNEDIFRLVFQDGASVQTKSNGEVGTVKSVDDPKKNQCKVQFRSSDSDDKGAIKTYQYSSLTWVEP